MPEPWKTDWRDKEKQAPRLGKIEWHFMQQQFLDLLQAQQAQHTQESGVRKAAEERRLEELQEAERIHLQEVREVEEQQRADDACHWEEKRLEQIRRDMPKMTPMTPNSDVEEYMNSLRFTRRNSNSNIAG